MGCEVSDTYQPHKSPTVIHLTVSQRKQLYHGFCFGSKALQVYIPNKRPTFHCSPIDEQSNESVSQQDFA
jgi:hypothetical protein